MPKRLSLVLLALVLAAASARSSFGQDTIIELTNADIVTMVKAKLPQELIIAKIKSSRCRFDTFPTVLSELKYKGVSDAILMAMVQAPVGIAPSEQSVPGAIATGPNVASTKSGPRALATGSQSADGNSAEQTQITPRTEFNLSILATFS